MAKHGRISHYQGTLRSMVTQAADSRFDFYFHVTGSTTQLRKFTYLWQALASYTVAYHVTDPEVLWLPVGPSGRGRAKRPLMPWSVVLFGRGRITSILAGRRAGSGHRCEGVRGNGDVPPHRQH